MKVTVCANENVNVNMNATHKIRALEHKAHPNTIKYLYGDCALNVSVRRGA